MVWTQEHMITGTARVEWELHTNPEADIEIHEHGDRFTLLTMDEPYDPPGYSPEQLDTLVAWWTARKEAAQAYQGA